jgi:hypothetical protein
MLLARFTVHNTAGKIYSRTDPQQNHLAARKITTEQIHSRTDKQQDKLTTEQIYSELEGSTPISKFNTFVFQFQYVLSSILFIQCAFFLKNVIVSSLSL